MNTRNKPCACGSGKKSKKCCQDQAVLTEKRQEADQQWRIAAQRRYEEAMAHQDDNTTLKRIPYRGARNNLVFAALMAGIAGGRR